MIQQPSIVFWPCVVLFCMSSVLCHGQQVDAPKKQSPEKMETQAKKDIGSAPDQKAIDNLKKFLTGSKWKGTFTMSGSGDKLHTEEYGISKAEKETTGDQWVLMSSIKYMNKDITVPVPLEIKWIDRTPVIVLDQVTLPGMGTFDARVIIRKGMYAGTWAHGEVGGHLFGEITSAADAKKQKDQPPKKPQAGSGSKSGKK